MRAEKNLARIKLLALDFDGVMTDNRVLVSETGGESVFCSRSDGYGISHIARQLGIEVAVISLEANRVVDARCKKLGIRCFSGVEDKLSLLTNLCAELQIGLDKACFMGNDTTDIPCIKNSGFGVAVADAEAPVKRAAGYVTKKKGGQGAVREVCEMLVAARAK